MYLHYHFQHMELLCVYNEKVKIKQSFRCQLHQIIHETNYFDFPEFQFPYFHNVGKALPCRFVLGTKDITVTLFGI